MSDISFVVAICLKSTECLWALGCSDRLSEIYANRNSENGILQTSFPMLL